MKLRERNPQLAQRKGHYHSLAQYIALKRQFEKHHQPIKGGKFHQLAKKFESTIPRGLRTAGGLITTELLLEIINEEKLEEQERKRRLKAYPNTKN